MEDFNYVHSNCFEITMELSCCKYPAASLLAGEWELNRESLLRFMEATHLGIRGTVVDGADGRGIYQASVEVRGIAHNVTTTKRGEFWRLLVAGKYEVRATAYGYEDGEWQAVNVGEKGNPEMMVRRAGLSTVLGRIFYIFLLFSRH